MTHNLVISAISSDKVGIVERLSRLASEQHCNILESRMLVMGSEFALLMLLQGSETDLGAVESALDQWRDSESVQVQYRQTNNITQQTAGLAYWVQVVTLDGLGIIHKLSSFFSQRAINIHHLVTDSYHAPHTGTAMLQIELELTLPENINLGRLRDEFTMLCDELNLDASFEPLTN